MWGTARKTFLYTLEDEQLPVTNGISGLSVGNQLAFNV